MNSPIEMNCPYRAGNVISIRVGADSIRLQILRTFEPFNLACVMLVSPLRPDPESPDLSSGALVHINLPDRMVLKIFDSRWMHGHRRRKCLPAWTQKRQDEYVADVLSGHIPHFWARVYNDSEYGNLMEVRISQIRKNQRTKERALERQVQERNQENPQNVSQANTSQNDIANYSDLDLFDINVGYGGEALPQPTAAEEEVYFLSDCESMYDKEVEAYTGLQALQGKNIPRMFAPVTTEPWAKASADIQDDFLMCRGVLMEYVDGVSLKDLLTNPLSIAYEELCRNLLCSLNLFPYYNFCHGDLFTRNVIIRNGDPCRPENFIFVDFGQSVFGDYGKRDDETDEDSGIEICDQELDSMNSNSGRNGLEKKFGFITETWASDEIELCHEIAVTLRDNGVEIDLMKAFEVSSRRFEECVSSENLKPEYIQSQIARAMIMADIWCPQDPEPSFRAIESRLTISQKAHRIIEDLINETEKHVEASQVWEGARPRPGLPCELRWVRQAIVKISECITDEDFYCHPERSWEAFCRASRCSDKFSAQSIKEWDMAIFEKSPQTKTIYTHNHCLPKPAPSPELHAIDSNGSDKRKNSREAFVEPISAFKTLTPSNSSDFLRVAKVKDRHEGPRTDGLPSDMTAVGPCREGKRIPSDSTAVSSSTDDSFKTESWINEKVGQNEDISYDQIPLLWKRTRFNKLSLKKSKEKFRSCSKSLGKVKNFLKKLCC